MAIVVTGRVITGTSGEDHLVGSSWGDDRFVMTANEYVTDTIDGSAGSDTIDYSASQGALTFTLTGFSSGTVEADYFHIDYNPSTHTFSSYTHHQVVANLTSIENVIGTNFGDTITGNNADNTLNGGGGNDVIDGGSGHDKIIGGAGHDTMTGGFGNDTFIFEHASDGPMSAATIYDLDTIKDFVRGQDKIDLHALVNETANHHALTFIDGAAFSGVAGQVSAVFNGYGWLVRADLDGDRTADFQVLVSSSTDLEMHNHLQTSDFILA
jgi:Ca2+-binding RTX toxin-like protein